MAIGSREGRNGDRLDITNRRQSRFVESKRAANRGAFTLIELTVVVMLIGLFATMVVPNLAASKASREYHAFFQRFEQIVTNARETAIQSKLPVSLRFDDARNEFFLEQTDADENLQEIGKRVTLPEGMRVDELRQGTETVSSGEWQLQFYPDGSCDGGGIQLANGDNAISYVLTKLGTMSRSDGNLPDPTTERWQAGDYVHRD